LIQRFDRALTPLTGVSPGNGFAHSY